MDMIFLKAKEGNVMKRVTCHSYTFTQNYFDLLYLLITLSNMHCLNNPTVVEPEQNIPSHNLQVTFSAGAAAIARNEQHQ